MRNFSSALPLSLYIHIPWCVRKCPYCDFNSHQKRGPLPEENYVKMLMAEFDDNLSQIKDRPIVSIFFGGGTPSLFSAHSIATILNHIKQQTMLSDDAEITLEANPGTVDQNHVNEYPQAGINRLSLGIQSLQNDKLKILGRIHNKESALNAIAIAKAAGFENFNLDIMYGLPNQTIEDALSDIEEALTHQPTHFSWYQLTIEPNTFFHRHPPTLPADDFIWDMQQQGQAHIAKMGYQQYEVSAYSLPDKMCAHNRNYWEFGDYLGIGAGAHSKLTDHNSGEVFRFSQVKNPRDYLQEKKRKAITKKFLQDDDLIFEFMLNALRLNDGVSMEVFTTRTGLTPECLQMQLETAIHRGLLVNDKTVLKTTDFGKRYLNDLIGLFLPY